MLDGFDHAWKRRALSGDSDALRQLCDVITGPLFAYVMNLTSRDHFVSMDVVQGCALRAMRSLEDFDPERSGNQVLGWLVGLSRNELRREVRARRLAFPLGGMEAAMVYENCSRINGSPLAPEAIENGETRALVTMTLAALRPSARQLLEAKYLHERSVKDIAETLRVPERTVHSRLSRARVSFARRFASLARAIAVEISLPNEAHRG